MVIHKGMQISSFEGFSFIYFMGSRNFMKPKYMKLPKAQNILFRYICTAPIPKIPQETGKNLYVSTCKGKACNIHDTDTYSGEQRGSAASSSTRMNNDFHQCCPDHEGPLPHTPAYLVFLCCVCLYSLILILRTLIYTFENQNH